MELKKANRPGWAQMTTGLPMDRRPDPQLPQDFWSALMVLPVPGGLTKRSLRIGENPCSRTRSRSRCSVSTLSMRLRSPPGSALSAIRVFGELTVSSPATSPRG